MQIVYQGNNIPQDHLIVSTFLIMIMTAAYTTMR